MKRFISRIEAAEILGCRTQTVANWVKQGILKTHQIGRAQLVDRESIEQLFDTAQDVVHLEQSLIELKKELKHEEIQVRKQLSLLHNDRINAGHTLSVYRHMMEAMVKSCTNLLSPKESEVLLSIIRGENLESIADRLKLTIPKTRIIAHRAINRTRYFYSVIEETGDIIALKAENDSLQQTIDLQKEMLKDFSDDKDKVVSFFNRQIEDCELSIRTINSLKAANIYTLGDLVRLPHGKLLHIRNFGKKSQIEIDTFIYDLGLHWDMDPDTITWKELCEMTNKQKQ